MQGLLIKDCQAQSCNFYLHFILYILQQNILMLWSILKMKLLHVKHPIGQMELHAHLWMVNWHVNVRVYLVGTNVKHVNSNFDFIIYCLNNLKYKNKHKTTTHAVQIRVWMGDFVKEMWPLVHTHVFVLKDLREEIVKHKCKVNKNFMNVLS